MLWKNKLTAILLTTILTWLSFYATPAVAQSNNGKPLGYWEDHFSYVRTKMLATDGQLIFVASDPGVFIYDKDDHSIAKLSKINGLSDYGVSQIDYHAKTKTLIIVYANGNIDLRQNGRIYNIPDLKIKPLSGDKSVRHIAFSDSIAYLSCGFGILAIDLRRREIYDTYIVGENTSYMAVNGVSLNDTAIFAATPSGIIWGHRNNAFLADCRQWHAIDTLPQSLSSAFVSHVLFYNNHLHASIVNRQANEMSVYKQVGTQWEWIATQKNLTRLKESDGKLVLFSPHTLSVYDSASQLLFQKGWVDGISRYGLDCEDALIADQKIWLAHQSSGLGCISNFDFQWGYLLSPSGPAFNMAFSLATSNNGKIYATAGSRTPTYGGGWIRGNIATFDGVAWTSLQDGTAQDSIRDILFVTPDPQDDNHLYAVSWMHGIVEIKNNKIVQLFDENNTNGKIVAHLDGTTKTTRVTGVSFDRGGNLIVAASLVPNNLVWMDKNGTWQNFYSGDIVSGAGDLTGLFIDKKQNYKWIWNRYNGIYVFHNNGNIQVVDPNKGALLTTNAVNCMVEDLNGEIWIGTEQGVKIIYNTQDAVKGNAPRGSISDATCQNIKYTEDGQTQYLLQFEHISTIAVDGANRKWIGTRSGGVFVLSPNGLEEIHHFTTSNSPLPSNNIASIAIDPKSGRVFVATIDGLLCYRGEATQGSETFSEVVVYPNPVYPEYSGEIVVKGLVRDANIRIADVSGNVVNNVQALGGQAVWNGKNFSGNPVSSGVYLFLCANKSGEETAVAKVMIIR